MTGRAMCANLKTWPNGMFFWLAAPKNVSNACLKLALKPPMADTANPALADQVREFEERIIRDALDRNDGNIKAVMEELDIPRRTLNEKMKKLNIRRDKPV